MAKILITMSEKEVRKYVECCENDPSCRERKVEKEGNREEMHKDTD